ncbi:ARF guanine-nucleotide exchange factor 2 [Nannizzia gypsea CBS 118893]|uniref:ARF guanine-nucleotide exchange factor 2 n=1 Tax=Arthroderma gypseum (strain ATCC MYA-4604 / CBS 118893) TaxID=535722 RepID=E4UYM6_ARTGP|nr:ARF guanine-nucleotide exchange factor 2 [Nannizzia gypsea CBS 118893]EFR03206.1 ARF guanine-nucleotide exchange factor 2 [Nannizzia gypsea CBS 118893]
MSIELDRDSNDGQHMLHDLPLQQRTSSPLPDARVNSDRNTAPLRAAAPIAINPVALVTTECIAVTSAMRKHARWAHSSVAAILGGGVSSRGLDREASIPMNTGSISLGSKSTQNYAASKSGAPDAEGEYSLAGRWGLRGRRGKSFQDNPLMSAFTRLRVDLKDCKDIRLFDTPCLLHPFLQVIRSSSTSAPITSLALSAITKFFAYNIINHDSPRLSVALQLLSAAITHCRFEASDSAADEIVLLRILKLMEGMLSRPEGELLGDESVCEMMETGLSMCCQVRLSEVLRRSAEMSMINMCQIIFQRLARLDVNNVSPGGAENENVEETPSNLKMDPSVDGETVASQHASSLGTDTTNPEKEERVSGDSATSIPTQEAGANPAVQADSYENIEKEIAPYGLPSIRELFRVLIDLLDPHNPQHTDAMRVMSLRIIDVALEVSGPSIAKHPSLAQLAKDDLCRHLFQLIRSDNIVILNSSLRVAGTLLATCRPVLKLQQELFLSYLVACLHPRVEIPREEGIDPSLYAGVPRAPKLVKPSPSQAGSGRSTPVPVKDRQKLGMEGGSRKPEAREAMVESIGALVRIPNFMAELFMNYDCDVDQADLCEDMVGLLSRNAFPDSATWSTTNVPPLCLDALLGYVQFLADRLDEEPPSADHPDLKRLRSQREKKKIIIQGTAKFNEKPKAGIAFLASKGIIQNPDDPLAVAKFLKGTTRVSKRELGDYLSHRSNEALLDAFIGLQDFKGKNVVEALRELLGSLRLPGEAPLIARIVTVFSEKYLDAVHPKEIADKDSLFVLTYAIILLNTDMYNPNIKPQNKMTYEGFTRNLRGVNNGKDFSTEYLQDIYSSIRNSEIILPDEHENKQAFDFAWKELLLKAKTAGNLSLCETNAFDADMFEATWQPVIATLSYVFMSASDDAVFSRVVIGFDQCAQIAAKYKLKNVMDRIIYCLSSISTLASETPSNTTLNTEIQAGKKSVMVSELAVRLGRDFRAQLATAVLFRVIVGNEAIIQQNGWDHIIKILHNLFINSLIPQFDSFFKVLDMPPIPLQPPSQVIDRDNRENDTSLLSAFTSYLSSYAADDPPEPSDEELENTLCTVDCINACDIAQLFTNLKNMPLDTVVIFVESLLSKLPDTGAAVIVVKPERPAPSPHRSEGSKVDKNKPAYKPGVLYILELATILTLRDKGTIEHLGDKLTSVLQDIARDAKNIYPLTLSRAVYYLLTLLRHSYEQSFMRPPVVLHIISSFDQPILELVATPVVTGLLQCINESEALKNELSMSPDFWSILQRLHQHQEAAQMTFELLQSIVESTVPVITADNYEAAVNLLNDFATAGGIATVREIKREMALRRPKPVRQVRVRDNPYVIRGTKAIGVIYRITSRIPALIQQSHLEKTEAWAAYWSPIFNALTTQGLNPCRDIRNQTMSALQRSLLSSELASTDHTKWVTIFKKVLFPLILELLKPEVYQSDPLGMSETRVQAATLLCKIFLHYLVLLSEWGEGMLDLWLRILDILDRMMNSGQGDSLEEAVPESLKNILLVMANGGYLVAPPTKDPEKAKIWTETQKRLDRFLPNLFGEIFPTTPADASPSRHGASGTMRPEAKQRSDPNSVGSKGQSIDVPKEAGSNADTEVGQTKPAAAEPDDEVE